MNGAGDGDGMFGGGGDEDATSVTTQLTTLTYADGSVAQVSGRMILCLKWERIEESMREMVYCMWVRDD